MHLIYNMQHLSVLYNEKINTEINGMFKVEPWNKLITMWNTPNIIYNSSTELIKLSLTNVILNDKIQGEMNIYIQIM